ncbi:hypothetical protein COCSUDRAFT_66057 [Coccomyxa subellipsoidea C-169]|uniref:N-acetyltransferase domain-containing protein n=1 Tax=Coccomyxa subellipsoidea (strain C-169) TaxID=574566 RepID=I0YZ80_COCSC|nr:hypothetical protein COCSUDRAFT_66057 [Coccomyxa subellipsoidea C-169]EIE23699.1 hypothetical protein COCSUDRAFT_66057 [Coccomyxa subellipsoidea C-169]|eukprot:XP_005648243.1 hypothetical protein COCSUDRAFT_66057 [Coccomyxa subellipsoidea C-169]
MAAQILARSFRDYPIWAYIQPRDEQRLKLLAWVLKRYVRGLLTKSGRKRGYAFAVKEKPSEKLLGVVLLWRPSSSGPGSRELQPWQVVRQGLLALPFRFGAGVTHRLLAADSGEEKQKDLLKPQLGAFWYLDYMAVDCAAQSRGLGSRTLSLCIRQAQAERDCPVLVNTCSEAARSFYLRNGFSEVGAQPVMIGGRQHWWMAFPAQSLATLSHDTELSHDDVPVKLTLQLAEAGSPGVPPLR